CLMQLASLTYSKEKKKDEPFIVPAENYVKEPASAKPPQVQKKPDPVKQPEKPTTIAEQPSKKPVEKEEEEAPSASVKEEKATQNNDSTVEPTPVQVEEKPKKKQKTSGLSLKSISVKREHKEELQRKRKEAQVEVHEEFTESQVQMAWNQYIKRLQKKGRKILPSILSMDLPKVDGTMLRIRLPNETMKTEVEREQGPLMAYIKRKIQNTQITLHIDVDEEVIKKRAYTP